MDNSIFIGSFDKNLTGYVNNASYSQIAVLVDENTEKHCLPLLDIDVDHVISITSGEINKNLQTCQQIWQQMTDLGLDRKSLLINLGGGVIGDMGGFCAATYKRGIDFINIPTTLLSMVDASVGGKLGIDFGNLKNHIGLFQNPKAVLINPVFLETLPERQLRSGFAEVIKHALITSREDWLAVQSVDFENSNWVKLIDRAIEIKSSIVEKDWKEQGVRKTLNFGHTIGHAVESYMLESGQPLLHGEAVAIGMIAELYLSEKKCGFDASLNQKISEFILCYYGKVDLSVESFVDMSKLAQQDKKNSSTQINAVLLTDIGSPQIDSVLTTEDIVEALTHYAHLDV